MSRALFDSPNAVDPLTDEAPDPRIARVPFAKILVFASLLLALTLCGAFMQRTVLAEPETTSADRVRDEALLRRRRILVVLADPGRLDDVQFEQTSLGAPIVAELAAERFVTWRVGPDMPEFAELRATHGVERTPALLVTTANGILLKDRNGAPLRREGMLDAGAVEAFLRDAAASVPSDRRARDR